MRALEQRAKELAYRMAKAFERLGYFIFEKEDVDLVTQVLESAKLSESLKVVHLGDVSLELGDQKLETGYYLISIDFEKCAEMCKGKGQKCLDECVNEKKVAIARSLKEVKVEKKASSLEELLKKIKEGS